MHDYVPREDTAYKEWFNIFNASVATYAAALGLTPAEVTELNDLCNQWNTDLTNLAQARNTCKGLAATKADTRQQTEKHVRKLVKRLQSNPAMDDNIRAALGIRIYDTIKTAPPIPHEAPLLLIDFSKRFWHILHWGPVPGNERFNGKPKGVAMVEVRMHVGVPPADLNVEQIPLAKIASKSPIIFKNDQYATQTIYYIARYLNSRLQPGPWCEMQHAEVSG